MDKYNYDFSKITVKEYRSMFDPQGPDGVADEIMARVTGLEADAIGEMTYADWKRFTKLFWDAARREGQDEEAEKN